MSKNHLVVPCMPLTQLNKALLEFFKLSCASEKSEAWDMILEHLKFGFFNSGGLIERWGKEQLCQAVWVVSFESDPLETGHPNNGVFSVGCPDFGR